jgi:hypothetical protein
MIEGKEKKVGNPLQTNITFLINAKRGPCVETPAHAALWFAIHQPYTSTPFQLIGHRFGVLASRGV